VFSEELGVGVLFLSLVIVLLALFMMAPQHKLSWLWRTACLVAALPPLLVIVGLLPMILGLSSAPSLLDRLMFVPFILSTILSAPLAAALSLAVAARLRRAA
jgi:hypothetical protein